jgi:large subunit ribosomal protein L19
MAATKLKHRRTTRARCIPQMGLDAKVDLVERLSKVAEMPDFCPGDTLRVHCRIKEGEKERIQIFEGTVIALGNRGVHRSFTIRKISHGVGVEKVFLKSSPKIAKIERVHRGKVRRAKLYYLRGREGKAARVAHEIEQGRRS